MEEFVIDINSSSALQQLSARERVSAYLELTKPRITFLIVLTAAAGFALASSAHIDYTGLLRSMLGIALLSSGIATINQYMERDLDALMRRTATFRWDLSSSIPVKDLPVRAHATPVVPLPMKGSSTESPGLVEARMHLSSSAIGFCVGCFPWAFSTFNGAACCQTSVSHLQTVFICLPLLVCFICL